MTQEEKQLLTKDICARIPYDLKVNYADKVYDVLGYTNNKLIIVLPFMSNLEGHPVETCKPYLRSMSSMTEEEKLELLEVIVGKDAIKYFQVLPDGSIDNTDAAYQDLNNFTIHWINFNVVNITFYLDWLNKKKFDYRGLIPMGLALPAPEGMYN